MAVLVVLFCETAGLWIVNNVLEIPDDRLFACNVIYQYVILSAALNITQVPLNATIISHERMNVYAYIGVVDVILKLIIAYLLIISSFDKLITLGTLQLIISLGMYLFYHVYCKRNFSEYNISVKIDKPLFKEMAGYSLWSLLGSSAMMLKNQGINILMNIFFGPVVNAANAIAYQVNTAVTSFSNNFTVALNPQIIKSYATDEKENMKSLIFRGGKFSFFLLMIISMPILLETDILLQLWLKNVPQYADSLTKLIILLVLIECFAITVSTGIQATGKIKYYQIIVAGIYLFNFPAAYIFYKSGANPTAALIISIVLALINVIVRLHFLRKYLHISIVEYFSKVLLISFFVFVASIILPFSFHHFMNYGYERLIIVIITSLFSVITFIYLLGLTNREKKQIKSIVINRIKKSVS
jgi:O-antigen/teichoic acid export membrane protein